MTRLSCHRFRPNKVRLWLSVIAYNLGNLWRRRAAQGDRNLVTDQLAAAPGQDRRPIDQTRPLLLVTAGGESPHTASIQRHVAKNRGASVAGALGCSSGAADFADEIEGQGTSVREGS
jgi:hypothetical protein